MMLALWLHKAMTGGSKMKNTLSTLAVSLFPLTVVLFGCSGAEDPTPPSGTSPPKPAASTSSAAPSSTGSGTRPTNGPCAPVGSKANEKGVGAYCDAKTPCSGDTFCTADFGAGAGAQFCSKQCGNDAECGEGALCYKEARGAGCVTLACAPGK